MDTPLSHRSHPAMGEVLRFDMMMNLSKIYGAKIPRLLMVSLSYRRGQTLTAAAGRQCHAPCARV